MTVLADSQAKRWLTITFSFLASVCLIAAFCTSEWGQGIQRSASTILTQDPVHLVPEHQERQMAENLQEWEHEIWTMAGYSYPEMASYRRTAEDHQWEDAGTLTRVFYDHDGMNRVCTFAEDGTLLELQEMDAPWLSGGLPASLKYVRDEKARQDISERLIAFLDSANPGMSRTIDHMQIEWECAQDGQIWMMVNGIPADPDNGEWITFVVRLEPEWQIQYFACISNG